MAVIRAKRLWLAGIPPNVFTDELAPQPPEVGTQSWGVYTVPPGKRAIVRSMTFQLPDPPASGNHPSCAAWVQPAGMPYQVRVFWGWFFEYTGPTTGQYRLWHHFNGQLVLHAGDLMSFSHTSTGQDMDVMGSGHELNEIT